MATATATPIHLGVVQFKLLDSKSQIKTKILDAMQAHIVKRLGSAAFQTSIRRRTQKALKKSLEESSVYQDMVNHGYLHGEIGLVNPEGAMNSLVRDWVKTTHVRVLPPRKFGSEGFFGSIVIVKAIEANYEDVLSKAYATYQTENGDEIPWLQWLLKEGSEVLVKTHRSFWPAVPTPMSRTGNTIMVKTKGRGWGVPLEYQGVEDNNFCTQSVVRALDEIGTIIQEEVTRRV